MNHIIGHKNLVRGGEWKLNNEKGVTLIELTAAIVLLSIVFFSFYAIFINAASHTQANKKRLSNTDIAERIIADVRSMSSFGDLKVLGFQQQGDKYVNDQYYGHEVILKTETIAMPAGVEGVHSELQKVVITVKPIKPRPGTSSFTTEIYWEAEYEDVQ